MSDQRAQKWTQNREATRESRQDRVRRKISLQPLPPDEYWIGIARTQEDLEAAYTLLHEAYVDHGIMEPHPSGMRCNVYQALPYTTTMIVKHLNRVIGTVSLIKDSPLGFPSDKSFRSENDHYRQRDFRMAEYSALAIHKEYRGIGHQVSMPLMKFAILYALRYADVSMAIATVHPKALDFYAALFNFYQNGGVVEYEFAKGALAVHLTADTGSWETSLYQIFREYPDDKNIYRYLFEQSDPVLHFPDRTSDATFDPVMTPELLRYFFVERTDVFARASLTELSMVRAAHSPFWNLKEVPILCDASEISTFRYITKIPGAWITPKKVLVGTIFDVCQDGVFFATTHDSGKEEKGELVFNLGKTMLRLPSVMTWKQGSSQSHYPRGYNLRFVDAKPEILELLFSTLKELPKRGAGKKAA